jgi:FMN phosphatase YigB (HAD superfamily)
MVFDRRTWELVGGERAPGGLPPFTADDLYPDALPCLRRLAAGGYAVGLAGNQPERAEAVLRALDAPVDFVASSGRWGVEKPSPVFFERVCAEAGEPAPAIAYVGDRLDNDVLPARRAGMRAVFVRRGPWGFIHATWPEVAEADHRIDTLAELPELLRD